MNLEEIKDLVRLVSKTGIRKLQVEREGFKISISGGSASNSDQPVYVQAPQTVVQSIPLAAPVPASPSASPAQPTDNSTVNDDSKFITIKSPMIGTFYRTPGPDKDPFVNVGSTISTGDKVCIIEAMKTFNEIESDISGKIVKVLVENASPVDYDQPLFLVDPS